MKKIEESSLSAKKAVVSSLFVEKMIALLVSNYNKPDTFFATFKKHYLAYYQFWSEGDKVSVVTQLFRHAYNAYARDERNMLIKRFLSFVDGIEYEPKTIRRLYDSFLLFSNSKYDFNTVVLTLLLDERFIECVNDEIQEAFCSLEHSSYKDLFVKEIAKLSPYLFDHTYEIIALYLPYNYDNYDLVIKELIKRKKKDLILSFIKNKNCLVSRSCLDDVLLFAKEQNDQIFEKKILRVLLRQKQTSFSVMMQYYLLLSDKEIEDEYALLENIAVSNQFAKAFYVLSNRSNDNKVLMDLTLREFAKLSSIIKKKYAGQYLESLKHALLYAKRVQLDPGKAVFDCLEKYQEDLDKLMILPMVKELSLKNANNRKRYLLLLKENNLTNENGVYSY